MQKAMGQFEEGIRNCTKSLELNPIYVKVLLRRGELYRIKGELDLAMKDFNRVLEIEPDNAVALSSNAQVSKTNQRKRTIEKRNIEKRDLPTNTSNPIKPPSEPLITKSNINDDLSNAEESRGSLQDPLIKQKVRVGDLASLLASAQPKPG